MDAQTQTDLRCECSHFDELGNIGEHCRGNTQPCTHSQAHNVPSSLSREPLSDFNLSFFFSGLLFLLSFPLSFTPFCFLFSPFWVFSAGRQKGFLVDLFLNFTLIYLERVTEPAKLLASWWNLGKKVEFGRRRMQYRNK